MPRYWLWSRHAGRLVEVTYARWLDEREEYRHRLDYSTWCLTPRDQLVMALTTIGEPDELYRVEYFQGDSLQWVKTYPSYDAVSAEFGRLVCDKRQLAVENDLHGMSDQVHTAL